MSYRNDTKDVRNAAKRPGAHWRQTTSDSIAGVRQHASIAADSVGGIHAVHCNAAANAKGLTRSMTSPASVMMHNSLSFLCAMPMFSPPVCRPLLPALLLVVALPALADNLLIGRHTTAPPKLSDGIVAFDGDGWLAPQAHPFGPGDVFQWDLQSVQHIGSVALQGDHNDIYIVSVSDDGEHFMDLYRAPEIGEGGLQSRWGVVNANARFVRLRAEGGDSRYSVTELELFSSSNFSGSMLVRPRWLPQTPLDWSWLYAVGVTALAAALLHRKTPLILRVIVIIGFLAFIASLVQKTSTSEVTAARLNWIRAAVALMGFVTVVRMRFFIASAHRSGVVLLVVTALLGGWCFLNVGRAQFWDAGKSQPTFLHHYDMRTYFPIAKYFAELRFDGVYAASGLVLTDEKGLERYAQAPLRDLRDHEMRLFGDDISQAHVKAVRERFTPERWASFVKDMAYFRGAMNDNAYWGSMNDHGGNATPVWFTGARLLFGTLDASDFSLWVGVIADIVLFALAILSLWWAFGLSTACIGLLVFGAMDFYMFGTNWFGAALRHDWLSLWCLGISFLKKDKPALGGAMLAWSAMIRAFPALAFVVATFPLVWSIAKGLYKQNTTLRFILAQHRSYVRMLIGAAIATVALFALSSMLFGLDAWVEWYRKVARLNSGGHMNDISIITQIVGGSVLASRLITVMALGLSLLAFRKAPLAEAAAWGAALVPVVFNPANYYLHAFFLLAVLGRESVRRIDAVPWLIVLLMCVGSWTTSLTGDLGEHFRRDAIVMVFTITTLIVTVLMRSLNASAWEQEGRVA